MLVATSGWWELENFNIVKQIVEEIAANFNVELGNPILRPNSSVIDNKLEDKKLIMSTLIESGYQLVKDGKISPDKLELISKPLMPFEDYIKEETDSYLSVKKSKK